ncbi:MULTISPECIES: hypothetical protein [Bosea]|uniref:hypothetical protein n=1 Tax=Bosea TaxID=85413 RepID=UPI0021500FBC|nr:MULTISPECIES: hypothetical protein [Bosea]MCR4524589.1 hypothetical protein [Bosea sp. 47.2.35]MDR6896923.1 hypothetical protein [Bosea sp. BE109]MDR7177017.1 hypothetical protein [Bosea sp. BE271]
MHRYAFCLLPLALAGCTDREPLAPAFAGEWASRKMGCREAPRITINKTGISAPGMPVNGLTFTKATVSGSTAHVVMELSASARLMAGSPDPKKPRYELDPRDMEVLATLVASGRFVNATNVMVRDKQTRQLRAVEPDVLAVMSLTRCDASETSRSFSTVGLPQAGQ